MKLLNIIYINLLLVFTVLNCADDSSDPSYSALDTSRFYQELNISYGKDDNQKYDLYLPANRTSKTKTMVLIHGGGWSSGDKADMNAIKDLVRQDFPNIAIANINYRLADANNKPYPMQIDDITSVIEHLKDNRAKYSISDDLGFIGTSAGGHLALLWSYAFDVNKKVDMVCSIVGPTNLTDPDYLNNTNPELQKLLDFFGTNPETSFLQEVSPLFQVKSNAPPTILFYGGKDPLIPTAQGIDLRDKLTALGVKHEFTLYSNSGHGWVGLELLDTWSKLKAFIQTHL